MLLVLWVLLGLGFYLIGLGIGFGLFGLEISFGLFGLGISFGLFSLNFEVIIYVEIGVFGIVFGDDKFCNFFRIVFGYWYWGIVIKFGMIVDSWCFDVVVIYCCVCVCMGIIISWF